jgi:hypothetical protein
MKRFVDMEKPSCENRKGTFRGKERESLPVEECPHFVRFQRSEEMLVVEFRPDAADVGILSCAACVDCDASS